MKVNNWRTEKVNDLFNAFLQLKNTEEVAAFCRDLMTEPELEEFASRFQIAKKLNIGESQRTIAKELGVSITTVTRVNQWLKRGEGGYRDVLAKLTKDTDLPIDSSQKLKEKNAPKQSVKSEKHHHKASK